MIIYILTAHLFFKNQRVSQRIEAFSTKSECELQAISHRTVNVLNKAEQKFHVTYSCKELKI